VLAENATSPLLEVVGWVGQACFFSRFFLQWLASEKARSSVVPRAFWWFSLAGALLMSTYSLSRGTTLLLFGFLVSAAIAMRNLWIELRGERVRALDPRLGALIAVAIVGTSVWIELFLKGTTHDEPVQWLAIGGLGQALWLSRFPLQWWLSERAGRSHFPPVFWWLSLSGNSLLLAYAVHLGNPVFILGFLPGPLLQVRNLMLSRRSLRAA
jgi:lipid-A-disaccharide synthase-like uncharacterized protein